MAAPWLSIGSRYVCKLCRAARATGSTPACSRQVEPRYGHDRSQAGPGVRIAGGRRERGRLLAEGRRQPVADRGATGAVPDQRAAEGSQPEPQALAGRPPPHVRRRVRPQPGWQVVPRLDPGEPRRPPLAGPLRRQDRSEERRVGKECRTRWSPYQEKKKRKENTAAVPRAMPLIAASGTASARRLQRLRACPRPRPRDMRPARGASPVRARQVLRATTRL